jgi:hypothetical protein
VRIADLISKEQKQQMDKIKSPKKQRNKKPNKKPKPIIEERINWHDLMDSNKRGLRRGKGGAWR